MIEKHELHCHNCNKYVRFDLDVSVDGNYKIICPNCNHEHYRIIKNGEVTDQRWGQDPSQNNYTSIASSYYNMSMFQTNSSTPSTNAYNSGNSFVNSWGALSSYYGS
jgi:hypothetical protein